MKLQLVAREIIESPELRAYEAEQRIVIARERILAKMFGVGATEQDIERAIDDLIPLPGALEKASDVLLRIAPLRTILSALLDGYLRFHASLTDA